MKTIESFLQMLEIGSRGRHKSEVGVQTGLSLVDGWVACTSDRDIQDSTDTSFKRMVDSKVVISKDQPKPSLEDIQKHFNYIMTEKARKDNNDRK
jgi:hypothetical protein